MPEWNWFEMSSPRTRWVQVFARLKPGQTVESAQAPLQVLFTQIRQYESTLESAKNWSAYDREQFLKGQLRVEKAAIGYSPLRNDFSTPLIVLMCMVGLVLLIACANVANLLIARAFCAPAGDRGQAVARRVAPAARPAAARREPGALDRRRRCWACCSPSG